MKPLGHYVSLFEKLNTDKGNNWKLSVQTAGRAPHKPILLLSVLDKFAQGSLYANLIELDADLGEIFNSYWATVMPPGRPGNIAMPYYHLENDGFWHVLWKSGKKPGGKVHSVTKLRELSYGAKLDDDLFNLLEEERNQLALRHILLQTYFSESVRPALIEQSNINVGAFVYSQKLLAMPKESIQETKEKAPESDTERKARNQGFRKAVREAYQYTCAMTGIRIVTDDGHVAVVGAHIVPWSENQDDRITNGIALSPTCHWAFDEGLLAVTDSYKVKVSPQIYKGENSPIHLAELDGRILNLPNDKSFWPDPENLRWHKRKIFRRW